MEGLVTELAASLQDSNGWDEQPATIDEEEDIWEVGALLAKWK